MPGAFAVVVGKLVDSEVASAGTLNTVAEAVGIAVGLGWRCDIYLRHQH